MNICLHFYALQIKNSGRGGSNLIICWCGVALMAICSVHEGDNINLNLYAVRIVLKYCFSVLFDKVDKSIEMSSRCHLEHTGENFI